MRLKLALTISLLAVPCFAQPRDLKNQPHLLGPGLLPPVQENAYGPNVNTDAMGRMFQWRTQNGAQPLGPIKYDAYGPGVGMDGTGAAVRAVPYGQPQGPPLRRYGQ